MVSLIKRTVGFYRILGTRVGTIVPGIVIRANEI